MHTPDDPEFRLARSALRDLSTANPWRYWAELLINGSMAYGSVWLGTRTNLTWPLRALCFAFGVIAVHRATVFLHEVIHTNPKRLPGLRLGWNLVWGLPLMLPSWMYERMHLDHHRRQFFGGPLDPEYSPLATWPRARMVIAAVIPVLVPFALALRFWVVGPISWAVPSLRRAVLERASTLASNPNWRPGQRTIRELHVILATEVALFAWGLALAGLLITHRLPPSTVGYVLAVVIGGAVLNQVRAHTAHRYGLVECPEDEAQMLGDSPTIVAHGAARLLFPLGVGFHGLHHLAPALPFHALPEAHDRVMAVSAHYRQSVERGAWPLLQALFQTRAP